MREGPEIAHERLGAGGTWGWQGEVDDESIGKLFHLLIFIFFPSPLDFLFDPVWHSFLGSFMSIFT